MHTIKVAADPESGCAGAGGRAALGGALGGRVARAVARGVRRVARGVAEAHDGEERQHAALPTASALLATTVRRIPAWMQATRVRNKLSSSRPKLFGAGKTSGLKFSNKSFLVYLDRSPLPS